MPKRQDARKTSPNMILVLLTTLVIALTGACKPISAPDEQTPSPTSTEWMTEPTLTNSPLPAPTEEPASLPSVTQTPTPDCRQLGGDLQEVQFFSNLLEKEIQVIIYLPPCYSKTTYEGFPVLYLLHGLSYSNHQWLRLGLVNRMDTLIARGEINPFIIVLPEEAPSKPPQVSQFPEILTRELIPWIDTQYATLPEKAYRGIGGLSRGAAWAVQIGFEHPSLFCCVGAHSLPLFKADGGKVNSWLIQEPVDELPRVFIDIGHDDREWQTAQNFANQLDAAHVPHEWYLFRYGHTEAYWSSHLDLYLNWYAKNW